MAVDAATRAARERTFSVSPVPPFRLDLTAWALRRRATNTIDRFDGAAYRRTLELDGTPVELTAVQAGARRTPRLEVTVRGALVDERVEATARSVLARLLGLDVDLAGFYALAVSDPLLGPLAARFRGVKPPRFPSLFECLVNAIACQQLTLSVGIALLDRLAAAHGATASEGAARAFPTPQRLAPLAPEELRTLGFSAAKTRSILALARSVAGGELDLEALTALDDDDAVAALTRLAGIGRWRAEYALLRGLGRLHVFPADDVGARNNLARWLSLRTPPDYAGVRAAVARFAPYAGLLYFHLLLSSINPPTTTEPAA